ncbi:Phenazine biosynthesis PhzF protein [Macleaya cordata]|uniref:Phenazine biosynthesis PhzF protein n=1 Tax=Macleaya cordata TaxID=56857 RepID=A0A200Q4V2_MACCD|nr:Phenazine biosynthesis PhzF protein [Macleaya cordata]
MVKKPVKYSVVDAFTDTPFKGNPAAVCLLEEERDEEWLKAVAREFNTPVTCYLTPIQDSEKNTQSNPRFRLRWFTTVAEVELCGHATLASAHVLFASGLVKSSIIEFLTLSGILIARKIPAREKLDGSRLLNGAAEEDFSIELDFPTFSVTECDPTEIPSIPLTLNGASMINIKKTAIGFIIVELPSGQAVADLEPHFDELLKCTARGVIITGIAPHGSGFDFFSRFFCPKWGVNEDPVCGSAHCALAPYWSTKLGKSDFLAYMASPRGGILDLHLDEETQRVQIRGKAVTVMEGSLFA